MSKARTPKPTVKKDTSSKSFSGSASSNQSEMKTSEIRDLIDFISKTGLNEVNIETQQLKLHVKREPDQKVFKSTPVAAPMQMSAPMQQSMAPQTQSSAPKTETTSGSGKKTADIKSPMIGTFYRSSGPEVAPFVSVGDKVTKGQTVCIIEAMKLFNEIESEVSGTIIKVMAENSSPVEYDQVLFVVEPD
jgi:acetyl-CoA carboxylase biotin carboxyl carrier protein